MTTFERLRRSVAATSLLAGAIFVCASGSVNAQTIVDTWASAPVPTAPPLKPAAIDTKTTALLVLDFLKQNCGQSPNCQAALPAEKALLAKARAAKMYIVYSNFTGSQMTDTLPDVAPLASEPAVTSFADKFINTDLDSMLKAKGIKTVIVTGMVGNGAGLYTASTAAQRGYNVVVPIDLIPANSAYVSQYVTYQLANGPTVANHVTLTKVSLLSF